MNLRLAAEPVRSSIRKSLTDTGLKIRPNAHRVYGPFAHRVYGNQIVDVAKIRYEGAHNEMTSMISLVRNLALIH